MAGLPHGSPSPLPEKLALLHRAPLRCTIQHIQGLHNKLYEEHAHYDDKHQKPRRYWIILLHGLYFNLSEWDFTALPIRAALPAPGPDFTGEAAAVLRWGGMDHVYRVGDGHGVRFPAHAHDRGDPLAKGLRAAAGIELPCPAAEPGVAERQAGLYVAASASQE